MTAVADAVLDAAAQVGPLAELSALVAAARNAPTLDARAVYAARARVLADDVGARVERLRHSVEALEAELARLASQGAT